MLQIKSAQFVSLANPSVKSFRERLIEHFRKCWPREFERAGVVGITRFIDYVIPRAATHGIRLERDVIRFLDTMMLLGVDFDVSPRWPWAREILGDRKLLGTRKAIAIWRRARQERGLAEPTVCALRSR